MVEEQDVGCMGLVLHKRAGLTDLRMHEAVEAGVLVVGERAGGWMLTGTRLGPLSDVWYWKILSRLRRADSDVDTGDRAG